jgi:hypothetical protein
VPKIKTDTGNRSADPTRDPEAAIFRQPDPGKGNECCCKKEAERSGALWDFPEWAGVVI